MKRHTLSPARRARLLAAWQRSGLSAAQFARRNGVGASTLFGWRRQARRAKVPAFVEVESVPARAASVSELVLELGASARLRLSCPDQLPPAAQLLRLLEAPAAC